MHQIAYFASLLSIVSLLSCAHEPSGKLQNQQPMNPTILVRLHEKVEAKLGQKSERWKRGNFRQHKESNEWDISFSSSGGDLRIIVMVTPSDDTAIARLNYLTKVTPFPSQIDGIGDAAFLSKSTASERCSLSFRSRNTIVTIEASSENICRESALDMLNIFRDEH